MKTDYRSQSNCTKRGGWSLIVLVTAVNVLFKDKQISMDGHGIHGNDKHQLCQQHDQSQPSQHLGSLGSLGFGWWVFLHVSDQDIVS